MNENKTKKIGFNVYSFGDFIIWVCCIIGLFLGLFGRQIINDVWGPCIIGDLFGGMHGIIIGELIGAVIGAFIYDMMYEIIPSIINSIKRRNNHKENRL